MHRKHSVHSDPLPRGRFRGPSRAHANGGEVVRVYVPRGPSAHPGQGPGLGIGSVGDVVGEGGPNFLARYCSGCEGAAGIAGVRVLRAMARAH